MPLRNRSVELLKFISMLFIVSLHIRFSSDFGYAVYAIARFAVPIFFMVMGYYVIKPKIDLMRIKIQIIKLIKYYVIYEGVYTVGGFILAYLNNDLNTFRADLLQNLKYFFISPVIGFQFWYLINVIWALVIVYIFARFKKLNLLFCVSIILHITGILFFHMSSIEFGREITRNFLFLGLFYIMMGAFFAKIKIQKLRINKYIILLFALFMILLQVKERIFWEQHFDSKFVEYYFSTIFAACSIFVFSIKTDIKNKVILRFSSYTMSIYFLHILVRDVLTFISSYFCVDISSIRNSINGNLLFILIICVISCMVHASLNHMICLVTVRFREEKS